MNPFPRQLILGHRGSPREAPENTLQSLGLALRQGADGVEMDVQRTRDGVPVVTHDDSLDRVWKISRKVSELDWGAVAKLTAAKVPSFEQVAAWAAASRAWLNVEIKAAGVEADVARLIGEMGIRERVIVSSFDADVVRSAGALDSRLRTFFLTERWDEDALYAFRVSGASGIALRDDGTTPAALRDLDERNIPLIVWTVNDPERVRELLRLGVAGLISDHPEMAARERSALLSA